MKEYIVPCDDDVSEFESMKENTELIRCKDCQHCRRELAQGKWEGSCRYWNTHSVMLNDFCSYGERKDNETD